MLFQLRGGFVCSAHIRSADAAEKFMVSQACQNLGFGFDVRGERAGQLLVAFVGSVIHYIAYEYQGVYRFVVPVGRGKLVKAFHGFRKPFGNSIGVCG